MVALTKILEWFKADSEPSEKQFRETWTSFWHKSERLPQSQVLGLNNALDNKASKDDLSSVVAGLRPMGSVGTEAELRAIVNPHDNDAYFVLSSTDDNGNPYIWRYDNNISNWINTKQVVFQDVVKKTELEAVETELSNLQTDGKQVKKEKIEGIINPTILDLSTVVWNAFISGEGTVIPSNGIGYTEIISVKPNTEYRIIGYTYPSGGCLYNKSGVVSGTLSLPSGSADATYTTGNNIFGLRINVKAGVAYYFAEKEVFDNLKYTLDWLAPDENMITKIDAIGQKEEILQNAKAEKWELSLKKDRQFEIISTFDNAGYIHASYPFWMINNSTDAFKFVQCSFRAKSKMQISNIEIAGAYITDNLLDIGTGYLCVRIYKNVVITDYKSDFTNATLLRKSIVPISDFYNNSTKADTSAALAAKLTGGERGYTVFNFDLLTLNGDDVVYIYFGVDNDNYYINDPIMDVPSCRMSVVTSNDVGLNSSLFALADNPTFLSSVPENKFMSSVSYPCIKLSSLREKATETHEGYISIDSRDVYTYVGAMNTVLDALFAAKPYARIAMIGHNTLSGMGTQGGQWFKQLVKVQQQLADYWGCPYLPLWHLLNWVNNPPTNTFITNVPDGAHPYTDTRKINTLIGQMSVSDYTIACFVKDWLKPMFTNWADITVACYGTSIGAGGYYFNLAVLELGGKVLNYCESGSVIRLGSTTHQPPFYSSLTDLTNGSPARNYQRDMLDLIGADNEPDLFIFDHGINDYNLDQTDFDISD